MSVTGNSSNNHQTTGKLFVMLITSSRCLFWEWRQQMWVMDTLLSQSIRNSANSAIVNQQINKNFVTKILLFLIHSKIPKNSLIFRSWNSNSDFVESEWIRRRPFERRVPHRKGLKSSCHWRPVIRAFNLCMGKTTWATLQIIRRPPLATVTSSKFKINKGPTVRLSSKSNPKPENPKTGLRDEHNWSNLN